MTLRSIGYLALFYSMAGATILPSLALDDPATSLLERLDGSYGCQLPPRRPWPGEVVVACLDSLLASPTLTDRSRLLQLRHRIRFDTSDADSSTPLRWRNGPDLLAIDFGISGYAHGFDRKVAVGLERTDSLENDILVGLRVRPRVDILLGPDLVLWSRPRQLVEIADQPRWVKSSDPAVGIYQTALFGKVGEKGRARTNDWIEGAIEFQTRLGRFTAGLVPLEWGDLPLEPLMLSGNTESIPVLQATKAIGPLEATLLAGRLIGDTWSQRRYLYAHRFAYSRPTWHLGWTEMILSVERDLEPLYLVPIFPYLFTEHYLGDPDNKQMDFDFAWRPRPGLEVSSELFLDDLQNYFGFFSNGWGNKWALGLGLKATDWTGPGSMDRIQIQRIEPWTGTPSSAILPGAPSNAPIHFGQPLGSSAGPNSASLAWVHSQDVSETWTWSAGLTALWKGTDLGSSVYDRNWRDSSGAWVVAQPKKAWLASDLLTRQTLTLGAEWRFAPGWRWMGSLALASQSIGEGNPTWHPGLATGVSFHE